MLFFPPSLYIYVIAAVWFCRSAVTWACPGAPGRHERPTNPNPNHHKPPTARQQPTTPTKQAAIRSAKTEAICNLPNGIGIVKLMGRSAGFIAVHATLASGDVDLCLVPEVPIVLEGERGTYVG